MARKDQFLVEKQFYFNDDEGWISYRNNRVFDTFADAALHIAGLEPLSFECYILSLMEYDEFDELEFTKTKLLEKVGVKK